MSKEMTAINFLKEAKRMCTFQDCAECEFNSDEFEFCIGDINPVNIKRIVEVVQKWSEEHPIKTRQSEFLKLYPNAILQDNVIGICPKTLGEVTESECQEYLTGCDCENCIIDYWLAEVEE